ncbi:hypothetical protein PG988_003958 [Apiospora saccharicola]
MITNSNPILATSTDTTTFTKTYCTIGTAPTRIQGPVEVATYTSTYSDLPIVSVGYWATSYVTEAPGRCELFEIFGAKVEPNPDISGIGVMAPP